MAELAKDSKAVKLLRGMFEKGQITGNETLKDVWLLSPVFQEHKLQNFRTCYSNLQKEFTYDGEYSAVVHNVHLVLHTIY